jgi:RNA polymerase sigma-70 factor (ECF subfamily)
LINRSPHTELPDAVLVTGYKENGNQQFLVALYQRYSGLLFGVCLKYLKSADDAKDACIEIYEELVTKLMKHEVENFRGWLHVVAKNHCLQKLRSAKNISTSPLPETFMQSEDPLHLEEVLKREVNFHVMEKCMQQLNDEQQQIVKLFYLEDKCYKEITELTGLSWNTVRSHIQNGRRNLKNCMEKNERE